MATSPAQQKASVRRALERVWDGGPDAVLSLLPELMLRWPEAFGLTSSDSSDGGELTYRRVSLGGAIQDTSGRSIRPSA